MERPHLDPRLVPLAEGLSARPTVIDVLDGHHDEDGYWWVKFRVDTGVPDAWDELQELAWLYNNTYIAVAEPVLLRPLAFQPHAGNGPGAYLHWSLECLSPDYTPDRALDALLTSFAPPRRAEASPARGG